MAGGVFRPVPRPPRRRRRILAAFVTAPQGGKTSSGVGGTALSVKTVAAGGVTGVGLAPKGQAVKTTAHVGVGDVGVGGKVTDRKVATPVSAGTVGVGATGTHSRVSPHTATLSGGVVGHSALRIPSLGAVGVGGTNTGLTRIASVSGTLHGLFGMSGSGAVQKAVSVTGRGSNGVSTSGDTGKVIEVSATQKLYLVTFSTSPGHVTGVTNVGVVAYGTAMRKVAQGGRSCIGVSSLGEARRTKPASGKTGVGLSPRCTSRSKVAPVSGRALVGVWLRGDAIRAGAVLGTRVSPPFALPDLAPLGSLVLWEATIPPGGTVTVETSVDNGATWQQATNGRAIPRLPLGRAVAKTVMTRATLTRPTGSSPTPRLHRLEVRVTVDSSRVELMQLGRFLINECSISDSPQGLVIDIAGADLSRKVQRNRWDRTYVISEGTRTTEAIRTLVRNRFPACTFNFVTTNDVTPRLFYGEQPQNDPWDDAQKLARDIGCDLFFDTFGVCTLRQTPDPSVDESVFEFDDTLNPTITELIRRVTDENTYNYVIVTGESSFNIRPVRGTAADRDPGSPTYVLGPYGIVALRVTTAAVVTAWQAQRAAEALLRKVKGATESVDFSAVPMPSVEPGDVITVTRGRAKVEGRFVMESIRMPLAAREPMRAVCRRQRY